MSGLLARHRVAPETDRRPAVQEVVPEPGFFEGSFASGRSTLDDIGFVQEQRLFDAYAEVVASLEEAGESRSSLRTSPLSGRGFARLINPFGGSSDYFDKDAIWNAVVRQRVLDPKRFSDLGESRDEFEQSVLNRQGAAQADAAIASRAGLAANLAGGMIASQADPFNMAANLVSFGGAGVVQVAGRAAVGNAALETVQTPALALSRARRGETLTAQEAGINIGAAFLGGGALAGAGKGLGNSYDWYKARGGIGSPVQRAARLLKDSDLELEGDWLDPSVRAVAEREMEIEQASPFVDDPAGVAAHRERLSAAMARIMEATPRRDRPQSIGFAMSAAGSSAGATGRQRGTGGYDPVALKAAIRGPESGGDDGAVNRMGSSASGRYQFVRGTFMGIYRQVYGGSAVDARTAWNNKRFDPATQEALMDRLMANNAAVLQRNGLPVDNGSMYTMHVLGEGTGPMLMRADQNAPVSQFLSAQVIRQNPSYFGGGRTVGQSLAEIASRVGGPSPAGRVSTAGLSDDGGALAAGEARIAQLESEAVQARDGLDGSPDDLGRFGAARDLDGDDGFELGDSPPIIAMPLPRLRPEFRMDMTFYEAKVPVSAILVDAKTFQFKSGGDDEGVTSALRGAGGYNRGLRNVILLWQNKAGDYYVADGHQRTGLARRESERTGEDIVMNADVLREADGVTAQAARVFAAIKNIADEKGSITDMAKVLRDAGPDVLARAGVSPNKTSRQAEGVAVLSDDAFGAMINKVIPEEFAALIGARLPDQPDLHIGMVDLLAKAKPGSAAQADDVIRQGIEAGFFGGTQTDMFGSLDTMASLFTARAKVKAAAMVKLRGLKRIFGTAASESDTLATAGNKIDVEASAREALANDEALALIDRLAFTSGPIKDAIDAAARRLASGERLEPVARDLARDIRAVDLRAATMDGADAGADAGAGRGVGGDDAGPLDEAALARFDDPQGVALTSIAKSLSHDFQLDAFGGVTAKDVKASLEAKAGGRLKGDVAQKAPGSDGGLFDAGGRQTDVEDMGFRFDEEGDAQSMADIAAEFAKDDAIIKTIKDCL